MYCLSWRTGIHSSWYPPPYFWREANADTYFSFFHGFKNELPVLIGCALFGGCLRSLCHSFPLLSSTSTVHIASVPHPGDSYHPLMIINGVHRAVVADPDAPIGRVGKLDEQRRLQGAGLDLSELPGQW